mmetsp:Transcript_9415/g.19279  ORF Transcript_9415/g.19279 Transcript_9415/m.19279 type:complete len:246 (-) Transcript_9415:1641-2378(-)
MHTPQLRAVVPTASHGANCCCHTSTCAGAIGPCERLSLDKSTRQSPLPYATYQPRPRDHSSAGGNFLEGLAGSLFKRRSKPSPALTAAFTALAPATSATSSKSVVPNKVRPVTFASRRCLSWVYRRRSSSSSSANVRRSADSSLRDATRAASSSRMPAMASALAPRCSAARDVSALRSLSSAALAATAASHWDCISFIASRAALSVNFISSPARRCSIERSSSVRCAVSRREAAVFITPPTVSEN